MYTLHATLYLCKCFWGRGSISFMRILMESVTLKMIRTTGIEEILYLYTEDLKVLKLFFLDFCSVRAAKCCHYMSSEDVWY